MLTDKQIAHCLIGLSDPMEVQRIGAMPIIAEFARAIADMVRAECVPPGFVVVPAEPTIDMLVAGTEDWMIVRAYEDRAAAMYAAMLSAAPGITAPQGEQP